MVIEPEGRRAACLRAIRERFACYRGIDNDRTETASQDHPLYTKSRGRSVSLSCAEWCSLQACPVACWMAHCGAERTTLRPGEGLLGGPGRARRGRLCRGRSRLGFPPAASRAPQLRDRGTRRGRVVRRADCEIGFSAGALFGAGLVGVVIVLVWPSLSHVFFSRLSARGHERLDVSDPCLRVKGPQRSADLVRRKMARSHAVRSPTRFHRKHGVVLRGSSDDRTL